MARNEGTSLAHHTNTATENINIYTFTPANYLLVDNTMYFVADSATYGRELWKSDGTASGTVLVADINPGSSSSNPTNLSIYDNRLFFTATAPGSSTELWTTTAVAVERDSSTISLG